MSDVDLMKLRAPFPAGQLGKLPRVTCGDCSDRRKTCDKHQKVKCGTCGAYVSTQHIHLDYVGHADVTSRLLDVDPEWSWAPKATDPSPEVLRAALASGDAEIVRLVIENAPPKFETDENGNPVGLWIKLTVGGVTRLGVGSCPPGQTDAEKVLIGDALRNAAMRFGVAVDLWAKGDRADPTAENATASAGRATRPAGKTDRDAQVLADEAHETRTVADLRGIWKRAADARKLNAVVASPATGETMPLVQFIDTRRRELEDADAALQEFTEAARMAGLSVQDMESHVRKTAGADIEGASAAQLRQAAAALKEGAVA